MPKSYTISMAEFKLNLYAGENDTDGVEFYYFEHGEKIGCGKFEGVHDVKKQKNGRYTIITTDKDGDTYEYTNIHGDTELTIIPKSKGWWGGRRKSRKRSHKKRATRRKPAKASGR